jgi:hypothetical protein
VTGLCCLIGDTEHSVLVGITSHCAPLVRGQWRVRPVYHVQPDISPALQSS